MSAPAPELKEWESIDVGMIGDAVYLYSNRGTFFHAAIYQDGNSSWDLPISLPFHKLRALIDEAERVGRHYWGEEWGKP